MYPEEAERSDFDKQLKGEIITIGRDLLNGFVALIKSEDGINHEVKIEDLTIVESED